MGGRTRPSRIAPRPKVMRQIDSIDQSTQEQDPPPRTNLEKIVTKLIMTASATIYECGIVSGRRLAGMQRKRHFAQCASTWAKNVGGMRGSDTAPSEWVHASLLALARQ